MTAFGVKKGAIFGGFVGVLSPTHSIFGVHDSFFTVFLTFLKTPFFSSSKPPKLLFYFSNSPFFFFFFTINILFSFSLSLLQPCGKKRKEKKKKTLFVFLCSSVDAKTLFLESMSIITWLPRRLIGFDRRWFVVL